jgi:hypothetical protein
MDGPVVGAARRALETGDVNSVLPYVPSEGEREVTEAFVKVSRIRSGDPLTREIADRYFFETVVRIHRAGEGAPFAGLKPAGLDVGPVIPVAEKAIETDDASALAHVLSEFVRAEVGARLRRVAYLRANAGESVDAARAHVSAALGLQIWAHVVYAAITSDHPHGERDHGRRGQAPGACPAALAPSVRKETIVPARNQ